MLCFYITVMSCYVASYFMLYNVLFLGYITCYVVLCLCYIFYITRNVMLRYITYYVSFLLRYITCYVMLYKMLFYVTLDKMLCCVMFVI